MGHDLARGLTPTALEMLREVSDRRVREKILATIKRLADAPEKQGKPLLGELAGLRSIRAVGQRYRIIYAIKEKEIIIAVVAAGIHREGAKNDIYHLAKKLFRLKLLG